MKNLEQHQQAPSEIRKKELKKKRIWKIFTWLITLAKIFLKFFLIDSDNLQD